MPRTAAIAALLCVGLTACVSSDDITYDNIGLGEEDIERQERGRIFGDNFSLNMGDEEESGDELPVNRFLWQASLETLSFLPLASTDPFGGVIVTDWAGADGAVGERYKVSAFISSAEFRPQSLRVIVNRQRRDEAGTWIAAPVADETVRQLEDAILTRARQLRIADRDAS